MLDRERLERLGKDLDEGRRKSYLQFLGELRLMYPEATADEISQMARDWFDTSDAIN